MEFATELLVLTLSALVMFLTMIPFLKSLKQLDIIFVKSNQKVAECPSWDNATLNRGSSNGR